jgi:hypothetical protein
MTAPFSLIPSHISLILSQRPSPHPYLLPLLHINTCSNLSPPRAILIPAQHKLSPTLQINYGPAYDPVLPALHLLHKLLQRLPTHYPTATLHSLIHQLTYAPTTHRPSIHIHMDMSTPFMPHLHATPASEPRTATRVL